MTLALELNTLSVSQLTFPTGLPGLASARAFTLQPLGEGGTNIFGLLSSADPITFSDGTEAPSITLVVAAPGLLWPGYSVEVDDRTRALLELSAPSDAAALVIVSLREPLPASTANLFAPIVVNRRLGLAAQMVHTHTEEEVGWRIATPLPPLPTP